MRECLVFGVGALLLIAAGAGCGGKVIVDATGSGGASTTSSAGGEGGAGPVDAGPDVVDSGPPPFCSSAADCISLNDTCNLGTCINGDCTKMPVNEFGTCDDGQFCTENDVCQDGQCAGVAQKACPSPDSCKIGVCDEALKACKAVAGPDGSECKFNDACSLSGVCQGGICGKGSPIDCSSFDGPCSKGVCDPVNGCKAALVNDGALCDDGSSCTSGSTCKAGLCGGGTGPQVYFADDFHDSSKGWLLGPEWQIGPAKASQGGVFGADPATDYTPSADNGVAGVVIGGNASLPIHEYYYLESPAFNTSSVVGPVILGFRRWLNSDYDPFMHNRVEVYNGVQWEVLWQSDSAPGIQDSPPEGLGWTFQQHDLSSYKSATMKIRFGFDIQQGGVFTVGSWNLDDVLVSSGACP
jgi:hypothetical protein